jgi:plasmid maintenance system antidote protein VapI
MNKVMTNKEKFLKLVSPPEKDYLKELQERKKNRPWIRASQRIAIKVLLRLEALDWSQKDLAEAMKVSPQQVNKIVQGKENLTLETITKLEAALGISILNLENVKGVKPRVLKYAKEEKYLLQPFVHINGSVKPKVTKMKGK